MIENLLTNDQVSKILDAINENKNFSFKQDGLQIELKDGQLIINYNSSIENERDKFLKLLQDIDDNIFIEICDYIGSDKLHIMQMDINSEDINVIKKGINSFKEECCEFLMNKINIYTECLLKLDK